MLRQIILYDRDILLPSIVLEYSHYIVNNLSDATEFQIQRGAILFQMYQIQKVLNQTRLFVYTGKRDLQPVPLLVVQRPIHP